jgi:septum formation inhibitor MinC
MFIALAERINIDYVVYNEQEEDAEEGEENLFGLKVDEEKFEVLINNLKDLKTPEGALTQQIENNIRTPLREVEIELKEELEEENKQEQQEQPEQPEQEEQPEKTPEPSLLERPSQNEEA